MNEGQTVEIRYIGKGAGIVQRGIVKHVNVDGSFDIELEAAPYGIKFSVLQVILHRTQKL